ncbi:hypothetical protein PNA2_1305 [Pyrococcus sp. NA2]|uniref:hypothetical protein n=1 Tax=Pyrococcus sp. (strain NA2) TaxID=342949 RepID=UPI000209AD69|nr:hypothetical protein [Pyrococcus sp. NA2]AEC52220.1 hypothetical protein PNA2_1305 [Pyrococcus sp. NA2]
MKAKSFAQLVIFILIVVFFGHVAWDSVTKEAAFFGALGGLTLHWLLTNKGNRNVVYIKPFTAGWRVLIYDILLLTWLITIYQSAGSFNAFLDSLSALNEKTALLIALLGGIGIDYSIGG